jgi:cytoskeleton protein RodZ
MEERESIGQILRHRREERGLTIEQAAFQSKVPLRLFQALEADDYHLLPDALYLIRLLHDLAVFLKLDPGALETEFRTAIRRPLRQTLAVAPPPPPPPTIPWKQVAWTVAAIVVITPLVFIALSLTSKRALETTTPTQLKEMEQAVVEPVPAEGDGGTMADRFLAMDPPIEPTRGAPTSGAIPEASWESPKSVGPAQVASRVGASPAPAIAPRQAGSPPGVAEAGSKAQVSLPRRYLLTAHALEPTWISVRADDGERRQLLLQTGQVARFVADTGFMVTLGNAGGVDLTLNGSPVPSPGKSGQVVRDMAIPVAERAPGGPGAVPPRDVRKTLE